MLGHTWAGAELLDVRLDGEFGGRGRRGRRPAGLLMRLRIELFVDDLDTSIAFYERILGFELTRRDERYASLRRGTAVLGLGPVASLPEHGPGPGFTRERLAAHRGAGVEIVLEVEDLEAVLATAAEAVAEPPQDRPWGLRDFRLTDPDGYYVRVTESG